jgi:predicted amidophosphoribosyltransferase
MYRDGKRFNPTLAAAEELRAHFSTLFVGRTFVPVPTSGLTRGLNAASWPALRIANALAAQGPGNTVLPLIARTTAIRKSSDPKSASRPSVAEHFATLALTASGAVEPLPLGIVLVDDVITRGATMTACASVLRDADWPGEVDAIAIAYTRGWQDPNPGENRVFSYKWNGQDPFPKQGAVEAPRRAP